MNIKFIIPISNFCIESAFKLGNVFYTPPLIAIEDGGLTHNNTMTDSEFEILKKCLTILESNTNYSFVNSTLAITSFENFKYDNTQQSFHSVNKLCEKIDRSLDYLRLIECNIGNFETLPGLPGIMDDGFKNVFKLDLESGLFEMVPGEVTFFLRKGIGLMPSREPNASDLISLRHECIFSDRDDEVFLNCRAALTRINEAMYMHNLNTAFIYLTTTLEMLADNSKFINFKKVKPRILPFISKSKGEYLRLSEYLVGISQGKRTEIVHNGKSIHDLYENPNQVIAELFRITALIVSYVEVVMSLGIDTFEGLESKRKELIKELQV